MFWHILEAVPLGFASPSNWIGIENRRGINNVNRRDVEIDEYIDRLAKRCI